MRVPKVKLFIIGQRESGRTALYNRMSLNKFEKDIHPKDGFDSFEKYVIYKEKNFRLQIWDVGKLVQRLSWIVLSHLFNSNGIFNVIDPRKADSLEDFRSDREEIIKKWEPKNAIQYIIESKSDLNTKRAIRKENVIELSKTIGYKYFECSSLTGENTQEIIYCILRDIIEREYSKSNKRKLFIRNHKKCIIF